MAGRPHTRFIHPEPRSPDRAQFVESANWSAAAPMIAMPQISARMMSARVLTLQR